MSYNKPQKFYYRTAQLAAWCVSTAVFRRRMLRNELKGKKGPFVVIANHEAMLDFVNLISAVSRPMSLVVSKAFYSTMPIKGFMKRMGVIPKQQFQTQVGDMRRIRATLDAGEAVAIYPAGLMCEDGLSTPIPSATYKFLKWLDVDVYVARTAGSYFVMPKWSKRMRPGRTYMDIYKLFSREELSALDLEQIKQRTDEALLFDAYREQEKTLDVYDRDLTGIENVLYMCPNCKKEFAIRVKNKHTIYCTECGFEQENDRHSFMHKRGEGDEIRYASDWSRLIYEHLKKRATEDEGISLTAKTAIHTVDGVKKRFRKVGDGTVTVSREGLVIRGSVNGSETELRLSAKKLPTLPFSPGKHLDVQDGTSIYRCVFEDGRQVMKFINLVKIFYEQRQQKQTV